MKVVRLETRLLEASLPRSFAGGTYSIEKRSAVLCRLTVESGERTTVCVGNESYYSDYFFDLLHGPFQGILKGHDALVTEEIWRHAVDQLTGYVDKVEMVKAMSTLDIALWDLKAKAANLPLFQLLGGVRDNVPIIAITGYYELGSSYDDIAREVERLREYGVCGVKWKVGRLDLSDDAARVAYVRKAAGDDFVIIADANMAWSPVEAIRFAGLIEDYNIRWLEEPVHWTVQYEALPHVRSRVSIPLAAGQSETSAFDCSRLIESGAVDVVNLCSNRSGGITAWSKVAGMAYLHGCQVANVAEPHIAAHQMAAYANGTYAECYADVNRDPFWERLYSSRPEIKDGRLYLRNDPGLGVEIDESVVEEYAIGPWRD